MPPGPKQAEIDRARERDPGSGFRFVAAERVSIQAPTTTRASVRQSNSSPGQELVAGFPAAPFLDEGRGDHSLLGEPVEEARCDEFAPVVERSTCGLPWRPKSRASSDTSRSPQSSGRRDSRGRRGCLRRRRSGCERAAVAACTRGLVGDPEPLTRLRNGQGAESLKSMS